MLKGPEHPRFGYSPKRLPAHSNVAGDFGAIHRLPLVRYQAVPSPKPCIPEMLGSFPAKQSMPEPSNSLHGPTSHRDEPPAGPSASRPLAGLICVETRLCSWCRFRQKPQRSNRSSLLMDYLPTTVFLEWHETHSHRTLERARARSGLSTRVLMWSRSRRPSDRPQMAQYLAPSASTS